MRNRSDSAATAKQEAEQSALVALPHNWGTGTTDMHIPTFRSQRAGNCKWAAPALSRQQQGHVAGERIE